MFNFLPQNASTQETTNYGFSGFKLPGVSSEFKLPSVGSNYTNFASNFPSFNGAVNNNFSQSSFSDDMAHFKKYFDNQYSAAMNPSNSVFNTSVTENIPNMGTKPAGESLWDRFTNAPFLSTIDPKTNQITQGMGNYMLSGLNSAMNLFMGIKNYNLAKQQIDLQKKEYERNFQAKQQMVNSAMEDRQKARVASNPNAYMNVNDYMNKYGIK